MANVKRKATDDQPMFFTAFNYKLIGTAILLIIVGFTAMYLENEINGFISLFVSPIVIMAGYILVVFAIMKHDREEEPNTASN